MIHYTTFAVYAMALVHGIGAGTDTSVTWALGMYAITAGVIVALVAQRLAYGSAHGIPAPRRTGQPMPLQAQAMPSASVTHRPPEAMRPIARDDAQLGYKAWARPDDR
jgi:hypothetical protein